MTKIVAFAGKKQSGKTTCANAALEYYITRSFGHKGKLYNFADALKQDICINILGLTYDQCYGDDTEKNSLTSILWQDMPGYDISWTYSSDYHLSGFMTARQVMQFIGTDIFRKMKNNIWSTSVLNKINNEKPNIAFIADCRFPDEVDAVKNSGGIVVKLTRQPFESDHISEKALDAEFYDQKNFDIILDNKSLSISEQTALLIESLQAKGLLPL
jgi:hypothetical protein